MILHVRSISILSTFAGFELQKEAVHHSAMIGALLRNILLNYTLLIEHYLARFIGETFFLIFFYRAIDKQSGVR